LEELKEKWLKEIARSEIKSQKIERISAL